MEFDVGHGLSQQGKVGEDVLSIEKKSGAKPRRAGEEREGNRDQLHSKAERLLLYLSKRLKKRDDDADHRRHYDRDKRKPEDDDEAGLGVIKYLSLTHNIPSNLSTFQLSTFNFYIIYPFTSPWIRSVQPLTMTNRSSLNGKEIVTGETIIMPIASRILETMMSIAINGR